MNEKGQNKMRPHLGERGESWMEDEREFGSISHCGASEVLVQSRSAIFMQEKPSVL